MITRGLQEVVSLLGNPEPFIRKRMEENPDVRVLEIGCGLGNATFELSRLFPEAKFYGFNNHVFPCQREAPNISYVYGDAGCHLPFEDSTIDFAFSIHTYQFIPDKIGLLREVHRVLKPGGEFWIYLSETLPELEGMQLCTISAGKETLTLKEFLRSVNNPEVSFRMMTRKAEGFTYVSPSVTILRKTQEDFHLPVQEQYTLTDLSSIFPEKKGYCASHYHATTNMTIHRMKKVLVIAASPHGYGHLYRGEIISRHLANNGFEVTYLSNSLTALFGGREESFSRLHIKMDSGPEGQESRRVLLEKVGKVRFDYVIVDHFPLGKLFFLDSFKYLHEKLHRHAAFICVFRDIFSIDDFRQRTESVEVLNRYFDQLFVFSDETVIPLPESLVQGIKIPIHYLGYLDADEGFSQITLFGGGGKYNGQFYRETLEVITDLQMDRLFPIKLFTGRTFPEEQREELVRLFPSISISEHSDDLLTEIGKSFITISTFGYNTFVQLLRFNNYNIIVPLMKNFQEQYQRAEKFIGMKSKASIILLDLKYKQQLSDCLSPMKSSFINLGGLQALTRKMNEV